MEAEYRGAAGLVAAGEETDVTVHLSGYVEPIDGKYHWGGRIQPDPRVQALAATRNRTVTLRTPDEHEATGVLGERDPWGGCRVTGTGAPPFPVATEPDDAEAEPSG